MLESNVFREILDGLDMGVATATPYGRILYANARFAETLGVPNRRELTGSNLRRFVAAKSWEALDAALQQAQNGFAEGEMRVESASNQFRTILLRLTPMRGLEHMEIRIVATDITELVEANEGLRRTEALLNSLSGRILGLQDEERRRIARDLHDITGQELAVVMTWLTRQANHSKRKARGARKAIKDSVELLQKVHRDVRTLSYTLHPPLLDHLGLRAALKWYVKGFNNRSGLEVNVEIPPALTRFGVEKETSLFRVVQESLLNVLLHAHSPRARIEVLETSEQLQVAVEDEGKGMARETLARLQEGTEVVGVGLAGMKERLRLLGGTLEVHSGAKGTRVVASLPLAKNESEDEHGESVEEKPAGREASRKILVVDDHAVVRRGIKALLTEQLDLKVCGEARNGIEVLSKAKSLRPDLIIMGLTMPLLGGLAAAQQLRREGSKAGILILTTREFKGLDQMVEQSGCNGYVSKTNAQRELIRGVRAVLNGARFFRPSNSGSGNRGVLPD